MYRNDILKIVFLVNVVRKRLVSISQLTTAWDSVHVYLFGRSCSWITMRQQDKEYKILSLHSLT